MNQTKNLIKTFSICLVLLIGVTIVSAWTGPSVNPPADNEEPPINISTNTQYKAGALGIEGTFTAYGQICLVEDTNCITSWPEYIGDDGDHTAGGDLDMDGNDICLSDGCRSDWPDGSSGGGESDGYIGNSGTHTAGGELDMGSNDITDVNNLYAEGKIGVGMEPVSDSNLFTVEGEDQTSVQFRVNNSSGYGVGFGTVSGTRNGEIGILTSNQNGSPIDLYIRADKVGIGNQNPSEKLDVQGNIKASGTVCGSNGCIGDGGGGDGYIGDSGTHTAGGSLDMSSNSITNVNEIVVSSIDNNVNLSNHIDMYATVDFGHNMLREVWELETAKISNSVSYRDFIDVNENLDMNNNEIRDVGQICFDAACDITNYEGFSGAGLGTTNIYAGSGGEVDFRDQVNMNGNNIKDVGNIWADAYYHNSDERLKNNIELLEDPLNKITRLEGVSFEWKDEEKNRPQIGLIAQDVEKVYPEIVKTRDNGFKSVQYDKLVAPMIEAIKEQQGQIEKQEDRIEGLEALIKELESRLLELEK